MITVVFQSGESVSIVTDHSVAAGAFTRMLKHLQHTNLQNYPFDNPYHRTRSAAELELTAYASKLGVIVDTSRLGQQDYLNQLHQQYEIGYNGHADWLHFHEAVHIYEQLNSTPNMRELYAQIDYRELAGPLNIKVTEEHLALLATDFRRGMCCIIGLS